MVAFGRPFYHGGLINRRTVLRALYGQLVYLHLGASEQKLDRIRESVLRLTRAGTQAGWRDRRRGPRADRRPDHLRRGRRPHRPAPRRGPPRRDRLGVAGGDRRPTRPLPRGGRVHRQPGQRRRGRPLHGHDGVLRLRGVQGRGDASPGGRDRASTWPTRTPTATPTPTCRCWRLSATRSPSTPTGCSPLRPRARLRDPALQPDRQPLERGCATGSARSRRAPGHRGRPPGAVALGVGAAAAGWWLGSRRQGAAEAAQPPATAQAAVSRRERLAAMAPRATSRASDHELLDHGTDRSELRSGLDRSRRCE